MYNRVFITFLKLGYFPFIVFKKIIFKKSDALGQAIQVSGMSGMKSGFLDLYKSMLSGELNIDSKSDDPEIEKSK